MKSTLYKNEEQGVELEVFEDLSAELRTTKPRNESMLGLVLVQEWADKKYNEHVANLKADFVI